MTRHKRLRLVIPPFLIQVINLWGGLPYLTQWRMQLARIQLQETADSISVLADRVGYQSEAAFCRAFKREFGVPPGSVRKQF